MAFQNYDIYKKVCGESGTRLIRDNYPESLDSLDFMDYISKKCNTKTNIKNVLSNLENLLYLKNSYLDKGNVAQEEVSEHSIDDVLGKVDYGYKIIRNAEELVDFKRFYAPSDILCTYNNPGSRLEEYHILVLFKKDFNKIKRSEKPEREDEYSTSLLNVQIHKKQNSVSIKSRYNNTVNNPDAVYSNNLDKIASGLTGAIERRLGIKIGEKNNKKIPNNLKLAGGYIINYWIEKNNIYMGEDVYVDGGEVHWIDTNQELIVNQFLINFKEKTVKDLYSSDPFWRGIFEKALKENKLEIEKINDR